MSALTAPWARNADRGKCINDRLALKASSFMPFFDGDQYPCRELATMRAL
jgi:hypothetical protein